MSALFVFTTKEKGDEQMKKRLFFVCALCALLAVALPALGERVELMDGRVSVELPEGVFCVRGSVTEEQAAKIAKWRQWSYYKLMYKEID